MKFLISIALLAFPLFAQSNEKLLWVRGPKDSEVVPSSVEEVLSSQEIRNLIAPMVNKVGYKIVNEEEATSTTSGEVLNVFSKVMKDGEIVRGLRIQISLMNAQKAAKRSSDPEILSQTLWISKKRGVTYEDLNFRRVTLQMISLVLSKRIGQHVEPLNLPAGKDIGLMPVCKGPGGYAGGPIGSTDQSEYEDPRIRFQPKAPDYPEELRKQGIAGTVVVQLTIDPSGLPTVARATEGPIELQKYAEEFALQFRFEPGKCDSKPIWSHYALRLPINIKSNN